MAGFAGKQSGLVQQVFRLIESSRRKPDFVVLENVAFALHLHAGQAIREVVRELEKLNYYWTYRVLDTREFGLPQRRRRVFIVATLKESPATILFDGASADLKDAPPKSVGFYWTEGNRGIGWAPEAIPPLKGGSGLSIPAPPAIWDRTTGDFFSPGLSDAERLQGFPPSWTKLPDSALYNNRTRWRLIGNAVSVPVAKWIGQRVLAFNSGTLKKLDLPPSSQAKRHNIAWGGPRVDAKFAYLGIKGPSVPDRFPISRFKFKDASPLSFRAASGFLNRLTESPLRADKQFVQDLAAYCSSFSADKAA